MTDRERVEADEDFIVNPRCENSCKLLEQRFKDGVVPDETIVKALALESLDELEELFIATQSKLKAIMDTDVL